MKRPVDAGPERRQQGGKAKRPQAGREAEQRGGGLRAAAPRRRRGRVALMTVRMTVLMAVLMVVAMVVIVAMVVVMRVAMQAGRGVGHGFMLYYNAHAEQATPPGGGFSPCGREIAPGNPPWTAPAASAIWLICGSGAPFAPDDLLPIRPALTIGGQ